MSKIIIVDLTKNSIEQHELVSSDYGRGLAVHLLTEHTPTQCSRLGEENAFVIVPGLLTGTPVPCANRAAIVSRDDTTGFLIGNITGDLPQKMASLQIGAIVIKGRSEEGNKVLYIDRDKMDLYDMPELSGRDCGEIIDVIRKTWGEDSAAIGCGPAADRRYQIGSLFATYPEGVPRFSCPRSSFGDVPASKGLRAVVIRHDQYFDSECKDRTNLQRIGKELAQRIIRDPICGGALPGLGSITLLRLMDDKEHLMEALENMQKKKTKGINQPKNQESKTNYCCAPMCVIGCLNKHSRQSGKVYSAPDESEVRAAVNNCFKEYLTEEEMDECASYFTVTGMKLGMNITELVFAISLYLEGMKKVPTLGSIKELIDEVYQGSVTGRILGGGTVQVCQIFRDNTDLAKKMTKPAVNKEHEYRVKMNRLVNGLTDDISDLELLYREIFLLENLGICIFSSFAILNQPEALQILADLYRDKTGNHASVGEMLEYSARCLEAEDQLRQCAISRTSSRKIPEFVKVLYRYFEDM